MQMVFGHDDVCSIEVASPRVEKKPPAYLGHFLWSGQNICLDQTGNGNTQWSTGVPVSLYVQPGHVPATGITYPAVDGVAPPPPEFDQQGLPSFPKALDASCSLPEIETAT